MRGGQRDGASIWTESILDQYIVEPAELPAPDDPACTALRTPGLRAIPDLLLTQVSCNSPSTCVSAPPIPPSPPPPIAPPIPASYLS